MLYVNRPKHILNQNFLRLNEVTCFWDGLVNLTAREGYQERHIVPDFNEKEIRKDLKKLLEENIPHEQEPILKEVIKCVQTGTKPDNIKEAHEHLFGFGMKIILNCFNNYYFLQEGLKTFYMQFKYIILKQIQMIQM